MDIILKSFELEYVKNHEDEFNTNNHSFKLSTSYIPNDYEEVLNKNQTQHWINKFHAVDSFHIITLDEQDMEWMQKAFKICSYTGEFSHVWGDELDNICKKYESAMPNVSQNHPGWFIRTEYASLKYSQMGCIPYKNFRDIIIGLLTTITKHSCFKSKDTTCNIYLMKWMPVEQLKEFRVFVHNRRITAISQQDWLKRNTWLASLSEQEIKNIGHKINEYFITTIREKIKHENYTIDLAILFNNPNNENNSEIYFIEINSFGANYAAGSALFHWLTDDHILVNHSGDQKNIEFRYVV